MKNKGIKKRENKTLKQREQIDLEECILKIYVKNLQNERQKGDIKNIKQEQGNMIRCV